jgi:dinuclear metal center YbgI/SA1388 family protein
MATVADILSSIDERYPRAAAEDWDVNGLTVGDPLASVTHVHFAVDPTLAVATEAIDAGAQLLVTHHPLMLRGVTNVAANTSKGAVVHSLVSAGVALANVHTSADAAVGGVADALARAVGVTPERPLVPSSTDPSVGTGRVGRLEQPLSLGDFARVVAAALPATSHGVRIAGDLTATVTTVAVVGGSGDAFLEAAAASGVDVYISADLRHHPASDARELALLGDGRPYLLDVSHASSEWAWLHGAAEFVADRHGINATVSSLNTDPWTARVDAP